MTREIGSHGSEVAAGLADELGLKIINSEIVASNVAGSLGVDEGTVQRYLDGSASMFERWQIDKRKLTRHTSEQILRLAQQGNVLIRGWGAAALFRDMPQVISVRVCTSMAVRVRVMMERLGSRDAEAMRQEIERREDGLPTRARPAVSERRGDKLGTRRQAAGNKGYCDTYRKPRQWNGFYHHSGRQWQDHSCRYDQ